MLVFLRWSYAGKIRSSWKNIQCSILYSQECGYLSLPRQLTTCPDFLSFSRSCLLRRVPSSMLPPTISKSGSQTLKLLPLKFLANKSTWCGDQTHEEVKILIRLDSHNLGFINTLVARVQEGLDIFRIDCVRFRDDSHAPLNLRSGLRGAVSQWGGHNDIITFSLSSSRGLLFQVLFAFLETFRAGMMATPVSSCLELRARNLEIVCNSLSRRSSWSKVWLLTAEPGHRLDYKQDSKRRTMVKLEATWVPTMVSGGR